MKNLLLLLLILSMATPMVAAEKEPSCSLTKNSITIDIELRKGDMVKVYNLSAKLVKVHEVVEDTKDFEVCDLGLAAGEYFLSVRSNGIPWSAGKITVK